MSTYVTAKGGLLCQYLLHLLQDVVPGLVFGDGADKEATVVHTHTHSDKLPGTNLKVVKHLDCSEGIVSVPMEGGVIHHNNEVVATFGISHLTTITTAFQPCD